MIMDYLHTLIILYCSLGPVLADCPAADATLCLRELSSRISSEGSSLCGQIDQLKSDITGCLQGIDGCNQGIQDTLREEAATIETDMDTLCSGTTPTPPTEPPLVCSESGWTNLNYRIPQCTIVYDSLQELVVDEKLTKSAICQNIQKKIDCLYDIGGVRDCDMFLNAINRQIIDEIKFAQLFGCNLDVNGVTVSPDGSDCNIWNWLRCYNPLLKAVGIETISNNFDLNTLMNLNAPTILLGVAGGLPGGSTCSGFNKVSWDEINRCTDNVRDKCDIIYTPRRDNLWDSVLGMIYEIKTNIVDNVGFLLQIEEMCSSDCNDIIGKLGELNNCFSETGQPQDAINKYNQGLDISADCSNLIDTIVCVSEPVRNCGFVEKNAVNILQSQIKWKLFADICSLIFPVRATPGCQAENELESDITSRCSPQSVSALRTAILNNDGETSFCRRLQQVANCYAQYVFACPALDRRYWLAEVPLIHAANQMIEPCSITYQTFGGLTIQSVDDNCDMREWVTCLGDLWQALGVNPAGGDVLTLEGFEQLLALVWDDGDRNNRCQKVKDLNFDRMVTCVSNRKMNCVFPLLSLSDGQSYDPVIRDPFNVTHIKDFVSKACSSACTDESVYSEVNNCLENKNYDPSVLQTYPQDIIFSKYVSQFDDDKCRILEDITGCVDFSLKDCDLYDKDSSFIRTAAVKEASLICEKPTVTPLPNTPRPGTGGSSGQGLMLGSLMLTAISVVYHLI